MHVALFCCGCDRAAPATNRDERAVAALFLVRRQTIEIGGCCGASRFLTAVDVTHRLRHLATESRAGVQAAIDTDGVRVLAMDLARAHVDAVGSGETVF